MRRDPTEFRERFKRWKAGEKVYDSGYATPTMKEESDYRAWKETMPVNLLSESDYNLRRAYLLGYKPELQDDGYYHLPTRDEKTGEILKGDFHPTLLEGLAIDNDLGYIPIRKNGKYYTKSWLEYKSVPAYDDGKTPEETYYGKHLPDVTIEAPKVNPYVYYDGFGNAATIDSNGRRVLHDANTFDATGFYALPNAEEYEKQRLYQHKLTDPNHAYEFGNNVRLFVTDLVTAPMLDVAAEPVGALINKALVPILKYAKAYKISKAIDKSVKSTTPSVDEFNKLWYLNELTFEGPVEVRKFSQTPKVGDFIDYGFNQGALKGVSRETPLSELTKYLKEVVQKLYTNPATHGDWFPSYSGAKGSKLIHQNETGALPTSATGFIPKDATNSNSPWITSIHGEKPAIWYNRNKPYYNAQGYPSYLDIPETLVTNLKAAEQLGLTFDGTLGREVSKVLSAPEELPFEAVEYGIRPNMFGFFDRIKYSAPFQKLTSMPWVRNIPENPHMAYRIMGPLERDWLLQGNELSTRATNILTKAEEEAARTAASKVGRFNLFKAGAEHGGRKQFAKGQPWRGTTTTHGERQVLAIPGEDLPWVSGRHYIGPQGHGFKVGDVSFEEAPFGAHIDLKAAEDGFTGINPSTLNGSVIYSPIDWFGNNLGYQIYKLKR